MTNLLIIAALLYVPFSTVAWRMRVLTKAGIDYRIGTALYHTSGQTFDNAHALRGFMRIAPRTMPRIAAHAPHINPWEDMAVSIYDDTDINYCN